MPKVTQPEIGRAEIQSRQTLGLYAYMLPDTNSRSKDLNVGVAKDETRKRGWGVDGRGLPSHDK